jgi:hypothetical protein
MTACSAADMAFRPNGPGLRCSAGQYHGAVPQKRRPQTPPPARLGDVVSSLGRAVVTLLAAPQGLDVALTEAVIGDPLSGTELQPGDVLLAVGTPPADAGRVLDHAATACAGAVVLKGDVPVDVAEAARVALLALDLEIGWGQFYTLLRTALAGAGRPPEGGAPIGDLFALANAVAAMVGGAVTIEDPHSRVLAYSSQDDPLDEPRRQTILGRRVPTEWMQRLQDAGVFRKLWTSEDVVRHEDPSYPGGFRPRRAIAVRAGGEILGSIWVSEGRTPFGPDTDHALREAAGIAALHLIRARTTDDVERRLRGDLVRTLLEGRGPLELAASRLGIDADAPAGVIAFEPIGPDEAEAALRRESVLDLVVLYGQAFRRQAACAAVGGTIYALVPADADKPERLQELARDVAERAQASLEVRLRTGIGSIVQGLRDVPRSRWEADQVLRALTAWRDERTVASIDDVRSRSILLELRDLAADRPHLSEGKLAALRAYDAAHGTPYVATLGAYLDTLGDVLAAAQHMGVHPNTFRYRLRRLVEVSGIDLDDPDERVVTELQFRLR